MLLKDINLTLDVDLSESTPLCIYQNNKELVILVMMKYCDYIILFPILPAAIVPIIKKKSSIDD